MQIEIINVSQSTKPTAKGSYQQLDIAYKNLDFQGKVEAKKVMSFTNKDVFGTLSKATLGQVYDIDQVKVGEYWQWTKAELVGAGNTTNSGSQQNTTKASSTPSPKSTYETPEERALRQRMIVKQSSITSAISTLSVNIGKDKLAVEEVLKTAERYFNYVMDKTDSKLMSDNFDISDMDDDIPL